MKISNYLNDVCQNILIFFKILFSYSHFFKLLHNKFSCLTNFVIFSDLIYNLPQCICQSFYRFWINNRNAKAKFRTKRLESFSLFMYTQSISFIEFFLLLCNKWTNFDFSFVFKGNIFCLSCSLIKNNHFMRSL